MKDKEEVYIPPGLKPPPKLVVVGENSSYRRKDEKLGQIRLEHNNNVYLFSGAYNTKGELPDISKLSPDMKQTLADLATYDIDNPENDFDIVITSGYRKKKTDSGIHDIDEHGHSNAVDLRVLWDKNKPQSAYSDSFYNFLTKREGKKILMNNNIQIEHNLYHGTAPHIHLESDKGEHSNVHRVPPQKVTPEVAIEGAKNMQLYSEIFDTSTLTNMEKTFIKSYQVSELVEKSSKKNEKIIKEDKNQKRLKEKQNKREKALNLINNQSNFEEIPLEEIDYKQLSKTLNKINSEFDTSPRNYKLGSLPTISQIPKIK